MILESQEEEELIDNEYILKNGDSIGRKNTNKLNFCNDVHMSNIHCKINQIGSKFLFEDFASTNGSWLRLSEETQESPPYPLNDEIIFKIGNSAMY